MEDHKRMSMRNLCKLFYPIIILASTLLLSCDDSSSGPTTDTRIFTGTTMATSPTSCSGDSHTFVAAEGMVTVTLLSSTNNTDLALQVCAGGIDNNDCTINQTRVFIGQVVSGARKGASSQTLVLQPLNCSPVGGPPPPNPIDYTVNVIFQKS
jgi:hypothetical protein